MQVQTPEENVQLTSVLQRLVDEHGACKCALFQVSQSCTESQSQVCTSGRGTLAWQQTSSFVCPCSCQAAVYPFTWAAMIG